MRNQYRLRPTQATRVPFSNRKALKISPASRSWKITILTTRKCSRYIWQPPRSDRMCLADHMNAWACCESPIPSFTNNIGAFSITKAAISRLYLNSTTRWTRRSWPKSVWCSVGTNWSKRTCPIPPKQTSKFLIKRLRIFSMNLNFFKTTQFRNFFNFLIH